MLGDSLRVWFDLFAGMVIYRPSPSGTHESDGWINPNDIEDRFRLGSLQFGGKPYEPTDLAQREQVLNTLLSHASALCSVKLLERRRQISPPSLDYRVTQLGRRIGNWETPSGPTLLKRAVFFVLEAGLRAQRYWKVVAIGAAGWAVVNAFKFYTAAFAWASHSNFAISSAVIIAVLAVVIKLVLSILHSK